MNAYIRQIEYHLPELVVDNQNERLKQKTGIESRHICRCDETAADLAVTAAEKILDKMDRSMIDYVLFCTQSPDYYLPNTACILQERLFLSNRCGALDYNHGCTGYIYGLGLAKGLIESGQAKNVLLLTGETYSKYINSQDNAVLPLFGDAGTASIISAIDTQKEGIYGLNYGTDGSGAANLIVPVGGMRQRYQDTEVLTTTDKYGNARTNQNLYMNGGAIMEFALERVPTMVDAILEHNNLTRNDIDYYVFHQANHFMLKSLQKICRLMKMPYWNDVCNYGNTVSNSIPIALVDMMKENTTNTLKRVMLAGFGVGLSWGGCIVDLSQMKNNS